MGMFDTFYGKIRCPYCGELHDFEEQTKSYECVMENFKLGDYIDRGNQTYIYPFEAVCYKYKKLFKANIFIVKGQIVKFANEEFESKDININKLKNIEEGLGWKLDYQERCKQGIGYNNDFRAFGFIRHEYEKTNWKEHPKKIGNRLFALNNDWLITGVYKEIFNEDNKNSFMYELNRHQFDESYIYQVTNKLGNRIARVAKKYIQLMYDNGLKTKWDSDNPKAYFIQDGCKLEKIE